MHKHIALLFALLLSVVLAVTGGGCGSSNKGGGFTVDSGGGDDSAADADDGGNGDDSCGLAGCNGDDGSTAGSIAVTPANPVLNVVTGMPVPTQQMTATLNGQDVSGMVTWSYQRPDIGDVKGGSLFTPTGSVGGIGSLTATLGKSTGSTLVAVNIAETIPGNVTPGEKSGLDNPTGGADPAMQVVYPYDQTVFPLGVLAPDMQWNGAGASDAYKLDIKEKYYHYVEYFTGVPMPFDHLVAQKDWDGIESSGTGPQSDPLTVSLTRYSASSAYSPVKQTWHIAQGLLHGSIYYWELPDACGNVSTGRVLRIKPDATAVDQFFTSNGQCFGCHTVSRDGSNMIASWSTTFPFPIQSIDLTKNPSVFGALQSGAGVTGTFSAFNDKGDLFLTTNNSTSGMGAGQSTLSIRDSKTGVVKVPSALGAACGEPAWSPDGKHLAGICGMSGGGWDFDSPTGNVTIASWNGTQVSGVTQLVAQGSPGRPAYPSFSPDSQYVAFGRPTSGSRSIAQGDLWLTDLKGKVKHLLTASNDDKSFNAVFSPLRAGGYSWIVFMTRRDYGNQLVGADRQQLWITAIDDPPTAADPSHPPFYIRGQETCGKSENAYYALDPCKQTGQSCMSGVDCCTGQCIKNMNGQYTCGNPMGCSADGNSCKVDTDCCNAPRVHCTDGFCQNPPPQ
jgi:hypothetical protein